MPNIRVCSTCGMTSGRKWNVSRHISDIHGGRGQPLEMMDYILKVQAGLVPYPSYRRPSGLAWSGSKQQKNQTPSDLLVGRSFAKITGLSSKFEALRKTGRPLALGTKVCPHCLTHRVSWYSQDELCWKQEHDCDPRWVLDNPNITHQKDTAIAILEQKLPEYLAELVTDLVGTEAILFSLPIAESDLSAKKKIHGILAKNILDRMKSEFDALYIQELETSASNSKRSNNIKLEIKSNTSDWIRRLHICGITRLNKKELLEFFSLSHSTLMMVDIGDQCYLFCLLVLAGLDNFQGLDYDRRIGSILKTAAST